MNLPVLDPVFTQTPDADLREAFHSFTKGICPQCRELVDALPVVSA